MSTATASTAAPVPVPTIAGHRMTLDGKDMSLADVLEMSMDATVKERTQAITDMLTSRERELEDLLPNFMKGESKRLIKRARLTFAGSEKLQKCTNASFILTVLKAAECGFAIDGRLCHAVPYKKSTPRKDDKGRDVKDASNQTIWDEKWEAQCQFDYKGLIATAKRLKLITDCWARNLFENDIFEFEEENGIVNYKYKFAIVDPGEILGAFAVAKLPAGQEGHRFEWMSIADIHKIRARSQSWGSPDKDYKKKLGKKKANIASADYFGSGPWGTDPGEMQKKTVFKRLLKTLTDDPGLVRMLEIDDEDTNLDLPSVPEPEPSGGFQMSAIRDVVLQTMKQAGIVPQKQQAPLGETEEDTDDDEQGDDDQEQEQERSEPTQAPKAAEPTQPIGTRSDNMTPMEKFRSDMAAAERDCDAPLAKQFWTKWFGEASTVEFTAEEQQESMSLLDGILSKCDEAASERMRLFREKVMSYKQPGRVEGLGRDLMADKTYSDQQKQQGMEMVKQRLSQLTGNLPLQG